jgi:uncharacterized protein (TIGR02611 family)
VVAVSEKRAWGREDHNITLDAADDDWAWRRRIRSNPLFHRIYRAAVGVVGLVIVVGGLIMVPFPGPGWLVVFLGLAVWASEFEWAQRLLHRARSTLKAWSEWLKPQPWWMKGLVLLVTVAAVAAIFWVLFLISGIPGFFPDAVETWLKMLPGLAD